MSDGGETASEFVCPHCGQAVSFVSDQTARRLTCPHCGGEFIAPAADGSTELGEAESEVERDPEPQSSGVPDEQLSGIRIRQVAAGRRATYRARSYCIIAAAVCAIATVQLVWMIVQKLRARGWGLQCTGYLLFALLALQGVSYFAVRALRLHREAKQSSLAEVTAAPDFSSLDDGSRRIEKLEDVR